MDAEYLSSMLDAFREQPFYFFQVKKNFCCSTMFSKSYLPFSIAEDSQGTHVYLAWRQLFSADLLTDSFDLSCGMFIALDTSFRQGVWLQLLSGWKAASTPSLSSVYETCRSTRPSSLLTITASYKQRRYII